MGLYVYAASTLSTEQYPQPNSGLHILEGKQLLKMSSERIPHACLCSSYLHSTGSDHIKAESAHPLLPCRHMHTVLKG